MSYQVLARKWRPRRFQDMVGQEHVLQALVHALEHNRLHHAYLFTGTRGVGKTTIGRLLARCLNCETGVTANPCGECTSCQEILDGRFVDLIEIDAASRTGVDDMRELTDNVQYAPTRGRFKVYLIDEVHMLSSHSFNALLKTLEEPPPHVKFLLATTDPQKLPVTVLSRCLQFHLKNLAPGQIVQYLQSVMTAEQVVFEEEGLWQIARAANGSMRDALTLLDQSISFGAGSVTSEAVTNLLGTPDHRVVFDLADRLADRDAAGLMQVVAATAENNADFSGLLEHLLSLFHRLAVAQLIPDVVDNSEGDRAQLLALASRLAPEDVQLYYQVCHQTLQEMTTTPDRRISFEMALLRMLAFSPDMFLAGKALAAEQGDSTSASEKKKPLIDNESQPVVRPVANEQAVESAPASPVTTVMTEDALLPQDAPLDLEPAKSADVPSSNHAPTLEPESAADIADKHRPADTTSTHADPGAADVVATDEVTSGVGVTLTDAPVPGGPVPASDTSQTPDTLDTSDTIDTPDTPDTPDTSDVSDVSDASDNGDWYKLVAGATLHGISGNILQNCLPAKWGDAELHLTLDELHSALYSPDHAHEIAEALSVALGRPIQVHVAIGPLSGESPAARRRREKQQAIEAAHQRFYQDPGVKAMVSAFDAEIDAESLVIHHQV